MPSRHTGPFWSLTTKCFNLPPAVPRTEAHHLPADVLYQVDVNSVEKGAREGSPPSPAPSVPFLLCQCRPAVLCILFKKLNHSMRRSPGFFSKVKDDV